MKNNKTKQSLSDNKNTLAKLLKQIAKYRFLLVASISFGRHFGGLTD